MTTWVEFKDEAAFHTYHDQACADQGIPRPGENMETGLVDLDAQWTTSHVEPVLDDMTLKAQVPVEDVDTYSLTETSPPKVTVDAETGMETVSSIPADIGHAKPIDKQEWAQANPGVPTMPPLEEM